MDSVIARSDWLLKLGDSVILLFTSRHFLDFARVFSLISQAEKELFGAENPITILLHFGE